MHYMHIKFSCSAYTRSHKSNIYLQHQVIQQEISANRRRERSCTVLGGLLPPSPDILGALTLIEHRRHHHRLPLSLLLRLLSGILLPPGILLPSSIDISSQCGVVLPHLLKFFLDSSQFVF
jgi:hypothetical protein